LDSKFAVVGSGDSTSLVLREIPHSA